MSEQDEHKPSKKKKKVKRHEKSKPQVIEQKSCDIETRLNSRNHDPEPIRPRLSNIFPDADPKHRPDSLFIDTNFDDQDIATSTGGMAFYMPKSVQHLYLSSVLEGNTMDDYFSRCRRKNDMVNFGSIQCYEAPLSPPISDSNDRCDQPFDILTWGANIRNTESSPDTDSISSDITVTPCEDNVTETPEYLKSSFDHMAPWCNTVDVLY